VDLRVASLLSPVGRPLSRFARCGSSYYLYDADGKRTARFIDVDENGALSTGDTEITEYFRADPGGKAL
jgi:hypothetical protein